MKEMAPTLTDAKGMGGIHAQDGFDYQVWDALIRLPAWLLNPAFEGVANEVLEDIEARFFAPHAPKGHLIERFQAKLSQLSKADLMEVFSGFRAFDTSYPGVARFHMLVTPSLPEKLKWLAKDPERVRRARPFYAPFADIQAASDAKLRSDIISEFGKDLGEFIADGAGVGLSSIPDNMTAVAKFAASFSHSFPSIGIEFGKLDEAHSALFRLLQANRGGFTARDQILATLREKLLVDPLPAKHLALHILSDRNVSRNDTIEIDARHFAGGGLPFPPPEEWRKNLLEPLINTATWSKKRGIQRVALSGSFRLSTAFAVGWSFRSAVGFEIDIPTKAGVWPTDSHPPAKTALRCEVTQPQQLFGDHLLVGIGILRDPSEAILITFEGALDTNLLKIFFPAALTDPHDVQSAVRAAKSSIDQACATLKPSHVSLFFVGPAAFGVALGHRWNGLPGCQLFEYLADERRYTPTVYLG